MTDIAVHIAETLQTFLTIPDSSWAFCTLPFFAVFVGFFSIFLLLRRLTRTGMLLWTVFFNLFFCYKCGGWMMLLLPATIVVSWLLTRWLRKLSGRKRKTLAGFIIVVELLPLLYFKYSNFLIDIWNDLFLSNFSLMTLALPVGISFYTFQAISYTADIFRNRYDGKDTLLEYAFYLSFFPLLLAGPITRAEKLLPQLKTNALLRPPSREIVYGGLFLVMAGIVKKGIIADYLAEYNNWIFNDPTAYSGFEDLAGLLGFTFQIYNDFSGYSDISIGLAGLLGFGLPENFRLPYQSQNLTAFWRRWHITLSTWFRDYVYIPLGGNRKGIFRTMINSLITMMLAGLWHGASMMFFLWGSMHGVALALHKWLKRFLDAVPDAFFVRMLSWMFTFSFIVVSWAYFRAEDLSVVNALFENIAGTLSWDYALPFTLARPWWTMFLVLSFVLHFLPLGFFEWLQTRFVRSAWLLKLLFVILVFAAFIFFRQNSIQPFIYSQF